MTEMTKSELLADKLLSALLTEKCEAVDELVAAALRTARYLLRNADPNDNCAVFGVLEYLTETIRFKLNDARFSDHPSRSVPADLDEEVEKALRKMQSSMLVLYRDGNSSEQTEHYLNGVAEATTLMLYSTIPLLLKSEVVYNRTDLDKEEWSDFIA